MISTLVEWNGPGENLCKGMGLQLTAVIIIGITFFYRTDLFQKQTETTDC